MKVGSKAAKWARRTCGPLIAGMLVSVPAFGQGMKSSAEPAPPAELTPAAQAEKLYDEGVEAAGKGQWEKARGLFEQAFKLAPQPQIAANLANAELELGKAREAAMHFDYFLRNDKKAAPADRKAIEDLRETALKKIGVLRVTVDVVGAEVFLDGKSVGKSPLTDPIYVDPGSYTVDAKSPNKTTASQRVAVAAGANLQLDLRLDGGDGGGLIETPKPFPSEEPWRKPLLYTSLAVGGVGLAIGVGLTVAAALKNGEVNDEVQRLSVGGFRPGVICPLGLATDPACTTLHDLAQARDSFTTVAIVGYALAGVGAVGALALTLTKPSSAAGADKKTATVRIAPTASGMIVFGSF